MNKPDWRDAPEWANWMAMDEDGEWFWFEFEPKQNLASWNEFDGNMKSAGYLGVDWRATKEARK